MLLVPVFVLAVVTVPVQASLQAPVQAAPAAASASTQQLESRMRGLLEDVAQKNQDSRDAPQLDKGQLQPIVMHAGGSRQAQAPTWTPSNCISAAPCTYSSRDAFLGSVRSAAVTAIKHSRLMSDLTAHMPPLARELLTGSR